MLLFGIYIVQELMNHHWEALLHHIMLVFQYIWIENSTCFCSSDRENGWTAGWTNRWIIIISISSFTSFSQHMHLQLLYLHHRATSTRFTQAQYMASIALINRGKRNSIMFCWTPNKGWLQHRWEDPLHQMPTDSNHTIFWSWWTNSRHCPGSDWTYKTFLAHVLHGGTADGGAASQLLSMELDAFFLPSPKYMLVDCEGLCEWVSECLNMCLNESLTDWINKSKSDLINECVSKWVTEWLHE